jgi:hypothetical protein
VLNMHAYAQLLFVPVGKCNACLSPTWIYLAYRQELCRAKTVRLKSVNKTSLQEDPILCDRCKTDVCPLYLTEKIYISAYHDKPGKKEMRRHAVHV